MEESDSTAPPSKRRKAAGNKSNEDSANKTASEKAPQPGKPDLTESLTQLLEQQKTLIDRISKLENFVNPPSSSKDPASPERREHAEEHQDRVTKKKQGGGKSAAIDTAELDFDAVIDDEELAENVTDDDENIDDDFDSFFASGDKTGEAADEKLAALVNTGLKASAGKESLANLLEKYPRAENVPALKTPILDKELNHINKFAKQRDNKLAKVQNIVGKSLSVVLRLMELQKKTLAQKPSDAQTARASYKMAADASKLLCCAHKELSQSRRDNVRPCIPTPSRSMCDSGNFTQIESNDLVFGDFVKRSEAAQQTKKAQQQFQHGSKNGQRGRYHYQQDSRPRPYPPQNKRPQFNQKPTWGGGYRRNQQSSSNPKSMKKE